MRTNTALHPGTTIRSATSPAKLSTYATRTAAATGRRRYCPRGTTRHGFGYSVFEHAQDGILTELRVYVAVNAECRIDSIAQSWAVLSGATPDERVAQALEALQTHLVRPQSQS